MTGQVDSVRMAMNKFWQKQEAAESTPVWYLLTCKKPKKKQRVLPHTAQHMLNFRMFIRCVKCLSAQPPGSLLNDKLLRKYKKKSENESY